MRILLMHSKDTWYKAVKPALDNPPDPQREESLGETVVVFVSVERSDTPTEVEEVVREVIEHSKRVGVRRILIYPFAHLSHNLAPPDVAYTLLVMLEEKLKKLREYEVHRAPFGWYKSFRVVCAGHPLCELSRSFKHKEEIAKIFYKEDSKRFSIKDAIERELLPKELWSSKLWSQKTIEIMERFGLYPEVRRTGMVMIREIEKWILNLLSSNNLKYVKGEAVEDSIGTKEIFLQLAFMLKSSLNVIRYGPKEPVIICNNRPGEKLVITSEPGYDEVTNHVEKLMKGLGENLVDIKVGNRGLAIDYDIEYEGFVKFYRSTSGSLVPIMGSLKVRGYQGTIIGPLINIVKMLLDQGIRIAELGETPELPFWLAPYQVAIIPVRDEDVSYAESIKSVIEDNVRVYLDPPTRGLGARIRAAARYWTPLIVIVGKKEVESKTVTLRRRSSREQETLSLESFIEELNMLRKTGYAN